MDNAFDPSAKVLDLLLDAVCVVDAEGRFVFVSAAFETIFGYAPTEIIGTQMLDLVHPDERARTIEAASRIMAGSSHRHFQNRYVRKDGRVVDIMWSARWSEVDRLRIAVARDVTEPRRAQALQAAVYAISEAAHAAEDLHAMYLRIHEILDSLLPAHNFCIALHDDRTDELSFPYHVDQHDPPPAPRRLDHASLTARVIRSGQPVFVSSHAGTMPPDAAHPGASREPLEWLGVPLTTQHRVVGALVVQSHAEATRYTEQDSELLQYVSAQVAAAIQRKQAELRLQYVARYDQLTDLPNRALFDDRLQTALARARRDGSRLALLYIDLDRFKQVNDTVGHAGGDLLLREVATRIKGCVRESDTVGRVGGDEFLVLLSVIDRAEHAAWVAEKIRHVLDAPFGLGGHTLRVSSSVGIAIFPDHGDDAKQLIRHADRAMYGAKHQGGNRCLVATTDAAAPVDRVSDAADA